MKNLAENLAERHDYDSLLIKLKIFRQTSANDITEINKLVEDIQKSQMENGSWEGTIVSTVYSIERLANLGVPCNDQSIRKATAFLIGQSNSNWKRLQSYTKVNESQRQDDFSITSRVLEFDAAKKYKKEFDPKAVCYTRLGTMQMSIALKLLVQMRLECDEGVKSALHNTYLFYKKYNSFCYFKIRKKIISDKKKL
jgi:hypothetical protein